ncbi:hypothetical protein JKP88DRAFT_352283 [Tribonema minus]|uniref:Uncharacterized protein n=1 Tax=Tribonema minus TaxID=303371 RepID=A0A835ZHU1_9STRA|nr:hypothetical protein JKP88DRAFT_352283 [Tribonema minus]
MRRGFGAVSMALSLCLACLLAAATDAARTSNTSMVNCSPCMQKVLRIRGGVKKPGQGKASSKGKKGTKAAKKVKITPVSYVKAFFASMLDPSYDEQFIEKPVHSASGAASLKKGKKQA